MDSKTDSKLGHLGAQWIAEIIGDVKKRRDDMQKHLALLKNEGHYKQAHVDALALLNAMLSAAAPQVVADDLMEWPIPCDVTVGAGTIKKGVSFRAVVACMKVLHGMAMKAAAPVQAQEPVVCSAPELKIRGNVFIPDKVHFKMEGAIFYNGNPVTYAFDGTRVDFSGWSCYAPGTAPTSEQKPVAWRVRDGDEWEYYNHFNLAKISLADPDGTGVDPLPAPIPLYAAPVQPVAVPDADEAFAVAAQGCIFGNGDVARAAKEWFKAGYKAAPAAQDAPACSGCGATAGADCNDRGCGGLDAGNGEPAAQGDAKTHLRAVIAEALSPYTIEGGRTDEFNECVDTLCAAIAAKAAS